MSVAKLKPCPFCGGKASNVWIPYIGGGGYGNVIECDDCWAKTGYYNTEAEAIQAWNRREGEGRKHNGKFLTVAKLTMMQKGMTSVKLHELTGIGRPTISLILNGIQKPYPSQKERIAKALDWTGDPDELFEEVQS